MRPYIKDLPSEASVLDLGCGNGRLLTGLANDVRYTGVDFSTTLLSEAKKIHPKHKFLYGDISKPGSWKKLGRSKYDGIFCIATLHHLPERKQQLYVLKEAKERLKQDGFLYISVWNLWQWKYLGFQAKSMGMKIHNMRWVSIPFANKWKRFCFSFDKPYMAELIDNAGLKIEKLYYANKYGEESAVSEGRNLVVTARL